MLALLSTEKHEALCQNACSEYVCTPLNCTDDADVINWLCDHDLNRQSQRAESWPLQGTKFQNETILSSWRSKMQQVSRTWWSWRCRFNAMNSIRYTDNYSFLLFFIYTWRSSVDRHDRLTDNQMLNPTCTHQCGVTMRPVTEYGSNQWTLILCILYHLLMYTLVTFRHSFQQ